MNHLENIYSEISVVRCFITKLFTGSLGMVFWSYQSDNFKSAKPLLSNHPLVYIYLHWNIRIKSISINGIVFFMFFFALFIIINWLLTKLKNYFAVVVVIYFRYLWSCLGKGWTFHLNEKSLFLWWLINERLVVKRRNFSFNFDCLMCLFRVFWMIQENFDTVWLDNFADLNF